MIKPDLAMVKYHSKARRATYSNETYSPSMLILLYGKKLLFALRPMPKPCRMYNIANQNA